MAAQAQPTGHPCDICFSEDGELTGCSRGHVICKGCLRAALRTLVGDVTVQDNIICGCFSRCQRGDLKALSERADVDLQHLLRAPPKERFKAMDFEHELRTTRQQFVLGAAGSLPERLYSSKFDEWYRRVTMHDNSVNHACSDPACEWKIENWMPIDRFEREYQSRGLSQWFCPDGHLNSVLPSQKEIDEKNRLLLQHPEYYTEHAECSSTPLRRHRLCEPCLEGGVLMLVAHNEGSKQWPGYGRGHHHCFCFACARPWGSGAPGRMCHHGAQDCADPGVQQVKLTTRPGSGELRSLEVGYVNGREYIEWLTGQRAKPPPTRFKGGGEELGEARQRRLRIEAPLSVPSPSRQGGGA